MFKELVHQSVTGSERLRKEAGKTDGLLLVTVFVLAGFGLLVLYSMSAYNGQVRFGDAAYYLKKQLFAMLFGFCLMYGIARTLIIIRWSGSPSRRISFLWL